MTDERLRELERQANAGDLDAEAELLLARVRSGELTEERLKLAAFFGHEAATRASGWEGPRGDLAAFERFGTVARVRAGLVLGSAAERIWQRGVGEQSRGAFRPLLERCEEWVLDPSRGAAAGLMKAYESSQATWDNADVVPPYEDGVALSPHLLASNCIAILLELSGLFQEHSLSQFRTVAEMFGVAGLAGLSDSELVEALVEELLPWALGTGDPVWSRVQVREGKIKIQPEDLEW